ncbi:MAG: hypothetical protein ACI9R3_006007 [Verrucomicrobiales bacterium]|jgi:hypothetical protein
MKPILTAYLLAFTSAVVCGQEEPRQEADVEVTAALIGYHSFRKLPSGERVWKFVAEPSQIHNAGFLFSVLEPETLKGRIFRLHHDGLLASGDPVTLYDPDRKYKFTIASTSLVRLDDAARAHLVKQFQIRN